MLLQPSELQAPSFPRAETPRGCARVSNKQAGGCTMICKGGTVMGDCLGWLAGMAGANNHHRSLEELRIAWVEMEKRPKVVR